MSEQPLSERVLDVSEMWHYTTCVTDTAPDAECDCVISNLADEIAALEAKCAGYEAAYRLADRFVPKYSPSATLIRAVLEGGE